jgi:hypothetical protein
MPSKINPFRENAAEEVLVSVCEIAVFVKVLEASGSYEAASDSVFSVGWLMQAVVGMARILRHWFVWNLSGFLVYAMARVLASTHPNGV